MKVRYTLAGAQPICSGCAYPADLTSNLPCANCGQHAGLTYPTVIVECDYQHADKVPPEHVFSGIVSIEGAPLRDEELRVDVFDCLVDCAHRFTVRITHTPTGLTAETQDASSIRAKAHALEELRGSLAALR
jgi:hypothetical protein